MEAQLQRIAEEHRQLLARIPTLSDLQSAWLLLLSCASTRADYFLRIVHPTSPAQFARQRDVDMWGCFCRLLDILPDRSFWEVASLPLSMGGLGMRSASGTAVAAHWASWADCLGMIQERHAVVADLLIGSLDAPPESAFQLSGATECRTLLAGVGFETPSWFVVASAPPRRPTVAETDPAVRAHGWQFLASRAVEKQFIALRVTPRLTPTERAAFFSQSGPMAGHTFSAIPTDRLFRFPAQLFHVLLLRRLWLPPVLSHLPVWPSTRRLWPPPRSVREGRGLGYPWVCA